MKRPPLLVAATLATSALLLTACGGGTTTTSSGPTALPAAPAGGPLDLKGVCPDTVVMQQDWQPEAEHGAIFFFVWANY